MKPGTNTSFDQLQRIDVGVLHVGYAEAGKSDGPAVMLLHGWPYDIHSYVDVAPRLAQAGYRVICLLQTSKKNCSNSQSV
jgi:pimeloyl-ACP methyl ester carboxylesterase